MPIKKYVQENSWIVTKTNNETSIPPYNFVAGGIKTTSLKPIFIKHTANAATKVLTFPPWENRPSKVIWKVFLYLYFCHVWKDLKGGVKTVLGIRKKRDKMCRDLGNPFIWLWRADSPMEEMSKLLLQHLQCALWISGLFLSQAWYCGCSSHLFRNLHFPGIMF
jgi:hypothetical protein